MPGEVGQDSAMRSVGNSGIFDDNAIFYCDKYKQI